MSLLNLKLRLFEKPSAYFFLVGIVFLLYYFPLLSEVLHFDLSIVKRRNGHAEAVLELRPSEMHLSRPILAYLPQLIQAIGGLAAPVLLQQVLLQLQCDAVFQLVESLTEGEERHLVWLAGHEAVLPEYVDEPVERPFLVKQYEGGLQPRHPNAFCPAVQGFYFPSFASLLQCRKQLGLPNAQVRLVFDEA